MEHGLFGKPLSTFPDHALAYAQRHGAGTLTLYLRRVFMVALPSRASGGVGVL